MSGYTYFVSYAGPDTKLAQRLADRLEKMGHKTIFYVRDFPKDMDFVELITDSLVESDYVIALVSSSYLASNWCLKEYLVSQRADKVIPVLLTGDDLSKLSGLESFIDLRRGWSDKAERIIRGLVAMQESLHPNKVEAKVARELIEGTNVVLPILSGIEVREGTRPMSHDLLHDFEHILRPEKVEVIRVNQLVGSKKDAEQYLRQNAVDFVVYGKLGAFDSQVGVAHSRGWGLGPKIVSGVDGWEQRGFIGGVADTLGWMLLLAVSNLHLARQNNSRARSALITLVDSLDVQPNEILQAPHRLQLRAVAKFLLDDWEGAVEDSSKFEKEFGRLKRTFGE